MKEIAIHLRLTESKARHIVETLVSSGFVDVSLDGARLSIHGGEKRQFKSDNVSARTAGWRERSGERSQNVPVNGPDTDTDTEQKKEPPNPRKRGKAAAPPVEEFQEPAWLPEPEWSDFKEMRRTHPKVKCPATMKAVIGELTKLREAGQDIAAVLRKSTMSGWAGVFAIEAPRNGKQLNGKPDPERHHPAPDLSPEQWAAAKRKQEENDKIMADYRSKIAAERNNQ